MNLDDVPTFDDHSDPETPDPIDWEARLERLLHVQNDPESHTERNAVRFHPSQLAKCKRQCAISKFGLEDHDTKTLGTFRIGTLIHEWLEVTFEDRTPGVHHEYPVISRHEHPDYDGVVEVVGTADVYDEHDGVVYDFKTRGGWYKFDPPTERHIDQLTLYMDAVGADAGQVVYINKKNLEVRTWPADETFAFDSARHDDLIRKAFEMRETIKAVQGIETIDDVPFAPCGCWLCDKEADR